LQIASSIPSSSAVVAFVDLAGSSAIADLFGDRAAIEVLERFEVLVRSSVKDHGEVVKWIGDEAMLTFADAERALFAMGQLIPACRAVPEIPLTRAGIHFGPVIGRNGDLFGSTVNVASRIVAMAGAGEVLASKPVADAAEGLGIAARSLGPAKLRSVAEPVHLFSLELAETVDPVWIDPVCKMLAPYAAFSRSPTGPWFCSAQCEEAFRRSPETYSSTETR